MATRSLVSRRGRRSQNDPRHLVRYLKAQAPGVTAESIAKSEGVSVATVRASITQIETYRKQNTTEEMDLAIRNMVVSAVPQARDTIEGLLNATELVETTDAKTGKKKTLEVEDKTTRLEAARLVKDLIIGLQPKVPQVVTNIQNSNQQANLSATETNEERLRRLRKQAAEFNQLPAEVAGVPDHIDAGEDGEEDDGDEEEEN
jgi:hypothetical protein